MGEALLCLMMELNMGEALLCVMMELHFQQGDMALHQRKPCTWNTDIINDMTCLAKVRPNFTIKTQNKDSLPYSTQTWARHTKRKPCGDTNMKQHETTTITDQELNKTKDFKCTGLKITRHRWPGNETNRAVTRAVWTEAQLRHMA